MYRLAQVILFITATVSLLNTGLAYIASKSIMDQLYTTMSLLVFVASIAGIGIISAVISSRPSLGSVTKGETQETPPQTTTWEDLKKTKNKRNKR
jgi:hypothetical protein